MGAVNQGGAGGIATGVGGGALTGAGAGAMFGPYGALAGAAIGAIGGGIMASEAANANNSAMSEAQRRARRAMLIQSNQVAQQEAQDRQRQVLESERIRGRLAVARGAAGVASGGGYSSYDAMEAQSYTDTAMNLAAMRRNAQNAYQRINSGYEAQYIDLANRTQNPLLAAFSGAMQGAQTGLAIVSAGNELSELANRNPSQPVRPVGVDRYFGNFS